MKVIFGHFVHADENNQLQEFPKHYLSVNELGCISNFSSHKPTGEYDFYDYGPQNLIIPGLIDTHSHLSQFAFAGIGDYPLLPWLNTFTFPHEERFTDSNVARTESRNFFRELVKNGTTTVVTYVTSHPEATDIAFQEAEKAGVRAFIGQVLMDRHAPEKLLRSHDHIAEDSEKHIKKWHQKNDRLQYIISPRFAISCSHEMLKTASAIAAGNNLFIQTHLSENEEELRFTQSLFPSSKNYTDVYESFKLLTDKTLFAHGIHLSELELHRILECRSIMVHCPTSNRFLGSGAMPARRYLDQGLQLSLGTDVAAGYSLSMFHEAKEAIETSKHFKNEKHLSIGEAFSLATRSAARSLNLKAGRFEIGCKADFIVVDDALCNPCPELNRYSLLEHRVSRILYRSHPHMIRTTFVDGCSVYESNLI